MRSRDGIEADIIITTTKPLFTSTKQEKAFSAAIDLR